MNSLTELNSVSATTITVTDNRPSRVIFDSFDVFEDEIISITSTTVSITPLNEVIDIWNYSTANVRYRVTINTGVIDPLAGSTVSWASIPAGLTLTTGINTYTITGFQQASDWTAVKTFTWNLPANWATKPLFSLTVAVIWYDSELAADVERGWFVYDTDHFYLAQMPSTVTMSCANTRLKLASSSLSSTVGLTATTLKIKQFDAGLYGTSSLTSIIMVNGAILEPRFTLSCNTRYVSRNNPASLSSQFTQFALNTTYLDAIRAHESYSLNTQTAITNGPLITDALQDGSGSYSMTVVPIPTAAVDTMSSAGRINFISSQIISNPVPNIADNFGRVKHISADGNFMVIASYLDSDGGATDGKFYLYQLVSNTWTLHSSLVTDPQIGYNKISSSANYMVAASSLNYNLYFYSRSGTTWSQMSSHGHASTPVPADINDAGDTVVCLNGEIWTRSGSSWSLQTTLTSGVYASLSSDGNTAVIANSVYNTNQGVVYVYTRSGSTWSLSQTITGPSTNYFGRYTIVTNDKQYIIISSSNTTYTYKLTGSTYNLLHTKNIVLYSFSKNGNYAITEPSGTVNVKTGSVTVYTRSESDWISSLTLNNIYYDNSFGADILSPTGNWFVTGDVFYPQPPSSPKEVGIVEAYNLLTNVGTSWNSSTKTLTLTGTRSQINTDLDTIQMTPATGYNSNFQLRYSVITPRNRQDSRDQNVNYS